MQRALGAVDDEVVDQRAVAVERLRPDAGGARHESAARSSGTKRRSLADEGAPAARAISAAQLRQKRRISARCPASSVEPRSPGEPEP